MIILFTEVLSRRLKSMKSEKITQQEDKLKYSTIYTFFEDQYKQIVVFF